MGEQSITFSRARASHLPYLICSERQNSSRSSFPFLFSRACTLPHSRVALCLASLSILSFGETPIGKICIYRGERGSELR
uniref:Uncharacterized protein n=1 Tax=Picea glauca TaxID=3330 RepID=A0A101M144_PICGL|nr:hypothetical protein ABT39_MTgene4339 [Picea glauca]QHR88466.1 hypothetical protein Q903MT_gene2480 [Picea sitchensis]